MQLSYLSISEESKIIVRDIKKFTIIIANKKIIKDWYFFIIQV